jgi:hypothetical protein
MAAVAMHHFQHEDPLRDDCIQMPFLFPRPQLAPVRDSKKAQKMLGLVTDPRPRSAVIDMHPIRDATKAKRTLGIVTDFPRDRRSWRASVSGGEVSQGKLEDMLAKASAGEDEDDGWTVDMGRSRQKDTQSATRGWIDIALEHEPERLATPSLILTPESEARHQSSSPLSNVSPIDLDAELADLIDLPPRRRMGGSRPRPLSFASSNLQIHNRPHNKIASTRSRGLRANTYPNFSRPIAPNPVPGEEMERDPLYLRYQDEPPTPASPTANHGRNVFDGIVAARAQVEEQLKRTQTGEQLKNARARPKKARWSSLPISLLQFAKRRSKTEDENLSGKKVDVKKKGKIDLTEDNLQKWEDEVGYVPKMYRLGYDILRSPVELDMEVEQGTSTPVPTPDLGAKGPTELPKLGNLSLLTPPSSPPQKQQLFASSSKPLAIPIPQAIPPSLLTPPLDDSNEPTLAVQKECLSRLVICTICREIEHPSTFPSRRITSKCTHMTRTCKECIQQWVETCVETRGWDRCTCPECGEMMSREDVGAFVGGTGAVR